MIEKFASIDGVHELTDMSKTNVRIGSGVIAPNSLLKENPKAVENFLSAIEETSQYIAENPEETADIMFKTRKQPNEITIKDLDFVNWKIEFSQKAYDSLTKQKEYMVNNGIIKEDFDLDSKLSLDAVKQVVPDRVTYEK
jgi:ABC-type nitrate/sulfonate/bicarbonate transport system substrate-binding protein